MNRYPKSAVLVALLSSVAGVPAFANLEEERRQANAAEIQRALEHDKCVEALHAYVQATNMDDATKVKSMSPRYTDDPNFCGPSLTAAITDQVSSGLNEATLKSTGIGQVRDIIGFFQGRSLEESGNQNVPGMRRAEIPLGAGIALGAAAPAGASIPVGALQEVQGRDLESALGPAWTAIDLIGNGYKSHWQKGFCLEYGFHPVTHEPCGPTNYPGRGIVPPSQNPAADFLVNDILDAGAAVARRSDNLIVQGVGTAAPAFGPGRSLGEALDSGVGDKMGDAAYLGTAVGAGLGMLGGAATGGLGSSTTTEMVKTDLGNGVIVDLPKVVNTPSWIDQLGTWVGRGIDAQSGTAMGGGARSGMVPVTSANVITPLPQTTISISIPTFGNVGAPMVQSGYTPAPEQQIAAAPQQQYAAKPQLVPQPQVQQVVQRFDVRCDFDETTAYAQSVASCEDAGGLVVAAQ